MVDRNSINGAPRTRRDLLKLGGVVLGAGVPLVMTLSSRQARATGSWSGSSSQGLDDGQRRPVPGSYEWREQQRKEQEQNRYLRNRYGGFGNE